MQLTDKVSYQTLTEREAGQRLDNYLIYRLKGVPKSHIYRMIRKGEVRINSKRVKAMTRLSEGDCLRLPPVKITKRPPQALVAKVANALKARIIFENKAFLVVDKPQGLAVHGGSGVSLGLIEQLRLLYENDDLDLVHRLDKATSGCILIAKRRSFLRQAHALLRENRMKKTYLALLCGTWQGPKQQQVDIPLRKHVLKSGERFVEPSVEGKPAKTVFQLIKNYQNVCLVKAYPVTGRTHQIRVHAAYLGLPIVGDTKYSKRQAVNELLPFAPLRMYLHASELDFKTDINHSFHAPIDASWQTLLDNMDNA